jgi:phosphocarrier protein HPr
MHERTVTIKNPLGLHARAAAQLVRMANSFSSRIEIRRHDNNISANAKSILSVLYIAAAFGVTISIRTEGDDESAAADAVEGLFLNGFGEI